MNRKALLAAIALALVAPCGLMAATTFVNSRTAVCDPATPANCAKPDSSGAYPVTMGAVPTGAATEATLSGLKSANHADFTSVVTALGNPLQSSGGTITVLPANGAITANLGTNALGTTSTAIINSGAFRYIYVQNVDTTNKIACAWGTTAIVNDSSSWLLAPGASRTFENSYVPQAALNCIASASGTKIYAETR